MKILIANIGSTSFKYRLFDMDTMVVLGQGKLERIGQPGGDCEGYGAAIERCLGDIAGPGKPLAKIWELDAIGFKAVHAGPHTGARLVDESVLKAMEEYSFLAAAHNPPYIAAMRAFRNAFPALPLVALFETAFFDHMADASTTYAVPYAWREEHGIRRYGFHGASHRSASERIQELDGRPGLRHISCHLGGSSSLAAIRGGVAVDTSFGVSPQSGIPQNNRTGDLDVFGALYLMKKLGLTVDEMAEALAKKSGLAGISGGTGDLRDLTAAADDGDPRSRLALEVYIRAIRHYLGAFLLELGGLDVLTFSGGIGENSAAIRAAVCSNLAAFGIELDAARNTSAHGETEISAAGAPVKVWIVPADEERIVARAAAQVVQEMACQRKS